METTQAQQAGAQAASATVGVVRRSINYVRDNRHSLIASGATIGGWALAAVKGPKIITGVALVGGGIFATFIAHTALTRASQMVGGIMTGIKTGVQDAFKATPVTERQDRPTGTMVREDPPHKVNDTRAAASS